MAEGQSLRPTHSLFPAILRKLPPFNEADSRFTWLDKIAIYMPTMSKPTLEVVVNENLNYYNYFTEVEEAFVSRRGAPMLISPLDWALVEQWKEMGIPLHIVLRGINRSFESFKNEERRGRKVNTLFYCQQEVLANYRDYVESQVGASTGDVSNALFPKQELIKFINSCREGLRVASRHAYEQGYNSLHEALKRASQRLDEIATELERASCIDTEGLERDLTILEDIIFETLKTEISDSELNQIREEAEKQMRPHKKRMEKEVYSQTLEKYVAKRLREIHSIPRLSLFYMG